VWLCVAAGVLPQQTSGPTTLMTYSPGHRPLAMNLHDNDEKSDAHAMQRLSL
jgi:hypothetical protein